MELRSGGRKLSFDVLRESDSFEEHQSLISGPDSVSIRNGVAESISREKPNRKKRRNRGSKKNKATTTTNSSIPEDSITEQSTVTNSISENRIDLCSNGMNYLRCIVETVVCEESVSKLAEEAELDCQNVINDRISFGELRQRTVNGDDTSSNSRSDDGQNLELNSGMKPKSEPHGNAIPRLETAESLDWKRLMAEDPNYTFSADKSPVIRYMEEIFSGNSLRTTTTFGNEKERERVYDTIFRLPWRCELVNMVLISKSSSAANVLLYDLGLSSIET